MSEVPLYGDVCPEFRETPPLKYSVVSMQVPRRPLSLELRDATVYGCKGLKNEPASDYRGTSLIRKRLPLGPYSRHVTRTLWWS